MPAIVFSIRGHGPLLQLTHRQISNSGIKGVRFDLFLWANTWEWSLIPYAKSRAPSLRSTGSTQGAGFPELPIVVTLAPYAAGMNIQFPTSITANIDMRTFVLYLCRDVV